MPITTSLATFNRNQSAIVAELERTGEPMYLTRNGQAAVVVMDAAAFDRANEMRERTRALEEEVYAGLMRGYSDKLAGRTMSLQDTDARIRAAKGW